MGKASALGRSCGIAAPCKINLHLRIGKKRDDGYHDVESIFLRLAFGDTLRFSSFPCEGKAADCVIEMTGAAGPAFPDLQENIVYRAVSLFRARTGFAEALRVRLDKRIPLGGGLGGGSSDGASALLALDALAETALPRRSLLEMAASLGSDVPFFLAAEDPGSAPGGAAWVSGRGELIRPLAAPPHIRVVLVGPGFPSATAGAFSLLDRVREAGGGSGGEDDPPPGDLIAALERDPASWPYRNDFLPVFLAAEGSQTGGQAYRGILRDLTALGADFSGLSGAGSTCFGIFSDKGAAEAAVKRLRQEWNFVQLTFPLARSVKAVLQ
jgi:4-diphosphocytidyl-2-C-methyl-D-erythritol kinase